MKDAFPILCRSPIVSTGVQTPNAEGGDQSVMQNFQSVRRVEETVYGDYDFAICQHAKQNRNDYYSEMKRKVEARNVRDRYTINRSRNHINMKDGRELIFQCSSTGVAPRNLLLELHGSDYHIPTWLEKRANLEFDNFGYSSTSSPPN